MQIFWVSGPVGQIRSINITLKTLSMGFLILVVTLVSAGIALQFFGFRMAIEYDPSIARQLGNLHTALELENLHAIYKFKLDELHQELETNRGKINELNQLNKKLTDMATPAPLRKGGSSSGLGGPYKPLVMPQSQSSMALFSYFSDDLKSLNRAVDSSINQTSEYIAWLESKPIRTPVLGTLSVSSVFGKRTDPLTLSPAMHPGIDINLPSGTPFYAAGAGKVVQVNFDREYGNQVVIDHGDGYQSRYAHASNIAVKIGTTVKQNQLLGTTGSTGRATGPHLHFEIMRNGEKIDPLSLLHVRADRS